MTQILIDWDDFERRAVPELWTPDEIYAEATEELLKKFYEDDRVERKPAGFHAPELAKWICMWANTPPHGGLILLGVDNHGNTLGCAATAETFIETERRIRSDLVSEARLEIKKVAARNQEEQPDYINVVRVYYSEDRVVETNKGEAYIRRAHSIHLLTETEKHELQIDRGQRSFEREPCNLKWPEDFNDGAIRTWAMAVKKKKNLAGNPEPFELLANHKLGKIQKGDFYPNNACALLFAKDPQEVVEGCMLRFQRIEGLEAATGQNRNVVKDIQIVGTIPEIIEQTRGILNTHLRTYSRLGADGKF